MTRQELIAALEAAKGPSIDDLLRKAAEAVAAMTPEEREEMLRKQRDSWARAEASWPKPKFKIVDGVKVYATWEDYCDD